MPLNWRKWNAVIHRDLGYLCTGLTLIYAISGVAVNHIHSWNPNYTFERESTRIPPLPSKEDLTDQDIIQILARLGETRVHRSFFQKSRDEVDIFFAEGSATSINLRTGAVRQERPRPRPVLYPMNFLHLNHPKKIWTWMADAYAVSLAVLALTGLFVLKGRKGITGRGAWLTGAGIAIPLLFLFLYL